MGTSNKRRPPVANLLEKADFLVGEKRFQEALTELRNLKIDFGPHTISEEAALYYYLQGVVLQNLGEKKSALAPSQRALEIYCGLGNFAGIAKSENLMGYVQIDLGDLKSAREHLQQAVAGYRYAKDWCSVARALNKMSYLQTVRGDLRAAFQLNDEAQESAARGKDQYFQVVLKGSRSVFYRLAGDWKSALNNLKDFPIETKKARDYFNYIFGLINRGHAYFLGERLKEARKNYLEAVQVCEKEKLIGNLKVAYEFLGELYLEEKRFDEAEDCLNKAGEIGERVSPYGTITTQRLRLMGDLYLAKGALDKRHYDTALEYYGNCQSYLIKLPERLEEGAMWRGVAVCYVRTNRFPAAQEAIRKSIEVFEACGNEWELAKTYVVGAEGGLFAPAGVKLHLQQAQEFFQKFEHPAWEKRVNEILERRDFLETELPLPAILEQTEKQQILKVLEETGRNVTRSAKKLGFSRESLQYRIKKYGIDV
jgi:tetratricopeptide (TPR) repeat protein